MDEFVKESNLFLALTIADSMVMIFGGVEHHEEINVVSTALKKNNISKMVCNII